jgi:tRNA nucleotidyltransferase (CCA-adding enzyme)
LGQVSVAGPGPVTAISDPKDLARRVAPGALTVCRRLCESGRRAWIVGGSVRDLMIGRTAGDWDIATDARPEEMMRIFSRAIPTGIDHGTVTVLVAGASYEVTTLRGETTYTDGRHPDAVVFVDDIAADLARRDFTVNAMAIDPVSGQIIDPWGGLADLERGILRAVGDPLERFTEDGLRPLRAARFAATLDLDIEPATLAAIEPALGTYRKVSAERVRDELVKAMKARRPSRTFEVMLATGMLAVSLPEMVASVGCEQNRFHAYDVWHHSLASLDACEGDAPLRIAALLHDVGKPKTRAVNEKTGDFTFYGHQTVGAKMAQRMLERLRFSNEERDRIVGLIEHHLVCYSRDWNDAAVRRFVRRVGKDRLADVFTLNRADVRSKGTDASADLQATDELQARVQAVLSANDAISVRDLAVDGKDVMRELGIGPGRKVGEVLERLLEKVIEDPRLNDREALVRMIREPG